MTTPLSTHSLVKGLYVTVLNWTPHDNSYKGDVLEIEAVDLPFVICKRHTGNWSGEKPISLDTRNVSLTLLSQDFVDAALGRGKTHDEQASHHLTHLLDFEATKPCPIQPNTYVARRDTPSSVVLVGALDDDTFLNASAVYRYTISKFRPATNDEILAHLIKEADKRGIRPGVSVKEDIAKSGYSSSNTWNIAEMTLITTEQEAIKSSAMVYKYWVAVKRPILISFSTSKRFPIDWVDAVPEKPALSITVDGDTYTPAFKYRHVEFGCARIANEVIVAAHELVGKSALTPSPVPVWGDGRNRSVTSVRIGKGDFSPALLAGLVKEIQAREMAEDDGYDYWAFSPSQAFSSESINPYYLRVHRQTEAGTLIHRHMHADRSYTSGIHLEWTKLPNRAAAEALLRAKT